MIDYLKNIIPRLSQFSKSLDKEEIFINKPWVFLDEEQNNHGYLFHRDKRLIMSFNGTVQIGSWELLPHGKLLIDRCADKLLLENMFIDDALMILKKSGSEDESFVLINEKVIPDLNAIAYLKNKETIQEISDAQNKNLIKLLSSGIITGSYFIKGEKVKSWDGNIVTGTFRSTDKENEMYVVVKNGRVSSTHFHIEYTFENNKIVIRQSLSYKLEAGDKIIDGFRNEKGLQKLSIKNLKDDNSYLIKIDNEGVITSAFDLSIYDYVKIIISVLVVIGIAVILLKMQ